MADLIAAEDTQHSAPLLQHPGVTTRMIAYHDACGYRSFESYRISILY